MKIQLVFDSENRVFSLKIPAELGNSLFITTLQISLGFLKTDDNTFRLELGSMSDPELYELIRKIINFLASEKLEYIPNAEAIKLIQKAEDELKKRAVVKKAAIKLLKKKAITTDKLSSPDFKRPLKDYQRDPVQLMIEVPYAANFSVPGSGKTTMLYAAYSRTKSLGDVQKLLIIAPSAAYLAWFEEYEKCFNKKPHIARITGPKRNRFKIYNGAEKYEVFVVTYQTAASDVTELSDLLKNHRFLLVLDESHNIKRFEGGIWASAVQKLAPYATRRVILTGTPVPNSLFDLWSQFHFLDPEIVGTQHKFRSLVSLSDAENELRNKLKPYYRRVKKSDLDLPQPIFKSVIVKPAKLQKKIYEAIKIATLEELKYAKEDRIFLQDLRKAIFIRLMQTASNPSLLFEKSDEFQIPSMQKDEFISFIEPTIIQGIKNYSKFEAPAKIVAAERLAKYILGKDKTKKLLIWSVWIKNLKILAKDLQIFNPVVIYGDVPINEEKDALDNREIRIKQFKSDPSCRVMIANPGACGESISLHDVCHDAIYLDRTFNAGQYMQSLDRIHRVGLDQSTKTNYYLLQLENTIDETVNRRLDEKRERMMKVLDEDFEIINLETKLEEISGISEETQRDFAETIKDLKK